MRCYSSRVDRHVDGSGTFVIDGLLAVGQASVHFCGEAYTATALRRDTETENDNDATNRQAYNIVHIPFEPGNKDRPSTSTTRTPTSIPTSFGEKNRAQPAATNGTTHVNRAASDSYSSREAGRKYSSSDYVHGRPSRKGFVSASSRSRSPVGSPHNLETDFLATLKTIARSAMVGFHSGLAGVMRDLTWTNGGITLVVDAVPSGCCTLRESLSGRLYQGTGIGRREGKQGSGATGAAGVVDRMLNLARQIAAAISRCHQTGVSMYDSGLALRMSRYLSTLGNICPAMYRTTVHTAGIVSEYNKKYLVRHPPPQAPRILNCLYIITGAYGAYHTSYLKSPHRLNRID